MRKTIKESKKSPVNMEKEKEVAKAKKLYKQAKKRIRMKKAQIKATSIEKMIDCHDPTWWKHYKIRPEESHITEEQIMMIEEGMIKVGKGENIPICKQKVEEAR